MPYQYKDTRNKLRKKFNLIFPNTSNVIPFDGNIIIDLTPTITGFGNSTGVENIEPSISSSVNAGTTDNFSNQPNQITTSILMV